MTVLCKEWQDILRLSAWRIHVDVCRHYDMPDGTCGHVAHERTKQAARIQLLWPGDANPANNVGDPYDIEQTLVHELVHLHLTDWINSSGSEERVCEEKAVESLSLALIALKRGAHV